MRPIQFRIHKISTIVPPIISAAYAHIHHTITSIYKITPELAVMFNQLNRLIRLR